MHVLSSGLSYVMDLYALKFTCRFMAITELLKGAPKNATDFVCGCPKNKIYLNP